MLAKSASELTTEDVKVKMSLLIRAQTYGMAEDLETFEALQAARARRLARAAARVGAAPDSSNARLANLRGLAIAMNDLIGKVRAERVGTGGAPLVTDRQWAAFGRVASAEGSGLEGATVLLYESAEARDPLAETKTSSAGTYALTLTDLDASAPEAPASRFHVRVRDAQGNVVYSSVTNLEYRPGSVDRYDIKTT